MKKSLNKKGFTIVELVIVIAVIGILSAILIPTFSGVVDNAKKANNDETVYNKYMEYFGANPGVDMEGVVFEVMDGTEVVAVYYVDENNKRIKLEDMTTLGEYTDTSADTITFNGVSYTITQQFVDGDNTVYFDDSEEIVFDSQVTNCKMFAGKIVSTGSGA